MFRYYLPVMALLCCLAVGCQNRPPSTADRSIPHPPQPDGSVLKICTERVPDFYTSSVDANVKAALPLSGKTAAQAEAAVDSYVKQESGGTSSGKDLQDYLRYICQMANNGKWSEATTERLINKMVDKLGGGQPLGKEKFLEALMADIQGQSRHLSELEEAAKTELALPGENLLVRFPPPLNTTTFNSMRVVYPKEFLELDNPARTNFIDFYRQLDYINDGLTQRHAAILSPRNMKADVVKFDYAILAYIKQARNVAQLLPQRQQ